MRLLLLDSDPDFCRGAANFLAERSVHVDVESHAEDGVLRAGTVRYDLIVLDFRMGLLNAVRERTQSPVLMTGHQVNWRDRVRSLECGADDFLPKPFHVEELLAHGRAILRRVSQLCEFGGLSLRRASRAAYLHGRKLDLTAMEWEILDKLTRCFGRTVTRDELSLHLHGRLSSPDQRAVDTHVARIRRKLGEARGMIVSVRGTGYQVCLADKVRSAQAAD